MLEVLLDEYVSHVAVYRDHLEVEVIGSPTAHASTGTAPTLSSGHPAESSPSRDAVIFTGWDEHLFVILTPNR